MNVLALSCTTGMLHDGSQCGRNSTPAAPIVAFVGGPYPFLIATTWYVRSNVSKLDKQQQEEIKFSAMVHL